MTILNIVLDGLKTREVASVLEKHVDKPNSFFKSLEEVDAAYRVSERLSQITDQDTIDKYNRYLSCNFGPEDTALDVFDTVFYEYPKFCWDLKRACLEKTKENLRLTNRDTFLRILEAAIDDEVLKVIATAIYHQKCKILCVQEEIDRRLSEGIRLVDVFPLIWKVAEAQSENSLEITDKLAEERERLSSKFGALM